MIIEITTAAIQAATELVKLIILAARSESGKLTRDQVLKEISRIRAVQTADDAAEWARVRSPSP